MSVANPQVLRRSLTVARPAGGTVEALTGLLMACHYRYLRQGLDHVTLPWQEVEPDMFAAAVDSRVATVLGHAVASGVSVEDVVTLLEPVTAWAAAARPVVGPIQWV